jgi:glycerophosphoryl diester phosphodiesterase
MISFMRPGRWGGNRGHRLAATADGKLVVIHNETLDRTSTGTGVVNESDLASVRDARLSAGGRDAVTDERVPTLQEARGRICINPDTKFPHDLSLVIAAV